MAPQPKLTVVNKVPNIPSVLLGLTQWIHTREAIVLRHAMTARAKVICTSRISSIYNTHGRTGSDWGRTGVGLGVGLGIGLGEANRGSDWGVGLGVGLGVELGVGRAGRTEEGRIGGIGLGVRWGGWTRGQTGGSDWGGQARDRIWGRTGGQTRIGRGGW